MKIKVAFFADILIKDFDGASRTMFHILDRIPESKFEFLVITGKGPEDNCAFEVKEVANFKIPFNNTYSMAFPVLNYFSLKKRLDEFRPDIVHIASPSLLGNFALDYADSRRLPKITIYHTHFISYVPYYLNSTPIISSLAKKAVIVGQRNFYNRCDLILVPTTAIKNELISYGFDASRFVLWQRGLDHNVFNPKRKIPNLNKSIFENEDPILLYASRMVWEKNVQICSELYHAFENEGKKINFLMVGDGVAKADLQKTMPRAKFTGKVDQGTLAGYYASSDIFVFPSVSETYGNVVIEAMACGVPCVVGNGGGSASFIRQGINGFKCDPENFLDFKSKIEIILASPTLKERIILNGIKYVQPLQWDSLVSGYFDLLYLMTEKTHQYV